MISLSKLQTKLLRLLLLGIWMASVLYSWYVTGTFGETAVTKLVLGGFGLWQIDDAITGRETAIRVVALPPTKNDPSRANRIYRGLALLNGVILYVIAVFSLFFWQH